MAPKSPRIAWEIDLSPPQKPQDRPGNLDLWPQEAPRQPGNLIYSPQKPQDSLGSWIYCSKKPQDSLGTCSMAILDFNWAHFGIKSSAVMAPKSPRIAWELGSMAPKRHPKAPKLKRPKRYLGSKGLPRER